MALATPADGSANRGRKRSLAAAAAVTERRLLAGARGGKAAPPAELRAGWGESRRLEGEARAPRPASPGGARRAQHGEEVEGRGGGGAGLLRPRRRRGEPPAQPERQPGQVRGVVEAVKFQAGLHQALGTPVAADAGEWGAEGPGSPPASARRSSPIRGAELASLGARAWNLRSRS